jgi:hypothetical protein
VKETRRLNRLGTLDSEWTVGFENKISLPGEIVVGAIAVDHETSKNRRGVKSRMMENKGLALQRHEV